MSAVSQLQKYGLMDSETLFLLCLSKNLQSHSFSNQNFYVKCRCATCQHKLEMSNRWQLCCKSNVNIYSVKETIQHFLHVTLPDVDTSRLVTSKKCSEIEFRAKIVMSNVMPGKMKKLKVSWCVKKNIINHICSFYCTKRIRFNLIHICITFIVHVEIN